MTNNDWKDTDWIEWEGGECPVEPGTLVDVKLRDGRWMFEHSARYFVSPRWQHGSAVSRDGHIIAYRVIRS